MKLKLKTSELQEIVGKAIKCSSNNKLIPLTSLMNIKVEDNKLTFTTTDATNYFYVKASDKVDCEDFEISVLADLFTKLVQKTTSETTELIVDNGILTVKGNGSYKMELPLDENGGVIKFPKKEMSSVGEQSTLKLKLSTVKAILSVNKASLAVNMELPSLTCYYCGDKVVTSDSFKICSTAMKTFEKPMLISPQLMELLGILSTEDISVVTDGNVITFTSEHEKVYAPVTEGIETFPIEPITGLVEQEFTSNCKVSKSAVMNVIERLSLFVSPYDKKGIYMTFNNDGILMSSKKSSGQELVPFIASNDFVPYTCCIDIEMLRSQISTNDSEELELYYGSEVAIKIVNKNITQIIALMDDDRLEG